MKKTDILKIITYTLIFVALALIIGYTMYFMLIN